MEPGKPLTSEELYRTCDPGEFAFATTAELEDFKEILGQDRAVEAIRFGVDVDLDGYNLFVLGPPGTGRHSFVREFLARRAAAEAKASDWCYVNNLEQPHQPLALQLPAGQGRHLQNEIDKLIEEAHTVIPAAFESEDYRARRQAIEEAFKEEQNQIFSAIQERAQQRRIALIRTLSGFAFAPLREGEVISPDEFQKLPEPEQQRIQEDIQDLEKELQKAMQGTPQRVRKSREKVRALDREFAMFAVGGLVDALMQKYAELPRVVQHLKSLQSDIVENVNLFLHAGSEQQPAETPFPLPPRQPGESPAMRRYGVNVIVDNSEDNGAPVIFEDHPTFQNLVGQIEHVAMMGALVTDFNLIKAGALHRANGGYLVLDAHKVLIQPYAWEGLKRALKSRRIRIESLGQIYSLVSTVSLEPEPIPLAVKVVMIGERLLYYLLQAYDPEFSELFKVAADFDDEFKRDAGIHQRFAQLLGTLARRENLKPIDRGGVARLIEHSARLAGDAERLTGRIRSVADVIREAHYWAQQGNQPAIGATEVQQAIDSQLRRASRIQERMQEEILRDTILIDTTGERIGQINGLAVAQLGDFMFGRPSRITARLRLGAGKVLDIEREVELGGPIHSKGVLILSSYLAAQYVIDRPLSLAASLVFEQSYGGVEGDSASSAELYALLSALAQAPIRQSLAVTGSVNQYGQVQAIGGVNEKIEGFFDICHSRGLTGEQGVLIPVANVKHLMLRQDVVAAVAAGRFHVYPVATIDQGIEILTGIPAGELDAAGAWPADTINGRVEARLLEFAEKRRAFAAEAKPEEGRP